MSEITATNARPIDVPEPRLDASDGRWERPEEFHATPPAAPSLGGELVASLGTLMLGTAGLSVGALAGFGVGALFDLGIRRVIPAYEAGMMAALGAIGAGAAGSILTYRWAGPRLHDAVIDESRIAPTTPIRTLATTMVDLLDSSGNRAVELQYRLDVDRDERLLRFDTEAPSGTWVRETWNFVAPDDQLYARFDWSRILHAADEDGDGMVDANELVRLFERYDANFDSDLDVHEKDALLRDHPLLGLDTLRPDRR
jgi:hypothetical protein